MYLLLKKIPSINDFLNFFLMTSLLFLVPILTIGFVYYFRDKKKLFECYDDRFIYILSGNRYTINKSDVINYRCFQGHSFYAELTIYLNRDRKILVSNLNEDFKMICKQMKDWNIETRPFFNFLK